MRKDFEERIFFTVTASIILLLIDFSIAGISFRGFLIALILVALILPMGLRHISGTLDLFEPLVMANIALAMMFFGRPLADIYTGTMTHLNYNIEATFDDALVLVLTGILAFQVGYHVPLSRTFARMFRRPPPFRPRRAKFASWFFFVFGGSLFGVFLIQSGGIGTLLTLLQGRAAGNNAVFLASSGYFFFGIYMLSASALIFFALAFALRRKQNYLWVVAMALPLIVFAGSRGTRSQLLPLFVSIPTFWYLYQRRRPSVRLVSVTFLSSLIIFSWMGAVRTAGEGARDDAAQLFVSMAMSPVTQLGDFFSSPDVEMFDSIANELMIVPKVLPHHPGGSIVDVFIRMVPRPIWPNKPLETNDLLVSTLWPVHYLSSRGSAAFSIIGPFYLDSGYFGVIVGMFLIGILLASVWDWYCLHKANLNALLIYCMVLPFVVILMRGTIPDTMARMLFMVAPLVLMMLMNRIRLKRSSLRRVRREKYT